MILIFGVRARGDGIELRTGDDPDSFRVRPVDRAVGRRCGTLVSEICGKDFVRINRGDSIERTGVALTSRNGKTVIIDFLLSSIWFNRRTNENSSRSFFCRLCKVDEVFGNVCQRQVSAEKH